MNRRGFLSGILAACAAPAIVRADSLMRILPMDTTVITATEVLKAKCAAGARSGLLTIDQITQEALRILYEQMPLGYGMVRLEDDGEELIVHRPHRFPWREHA